MDVKILGYEDTLELKQEWTQLYDKIKSRNIFLSYEWFSTWCKHMSKGRDIKVFAAFEEDLVGVVALFDDDGVLRCVGYPYNDYDGILAKNKLVEAEILKSILKTGPNRLEFSQFSGEIPKVDTEYDVLVDTSISCPILRFSDFEKEELRIKLNKKLVRRQINKLKGMGELKYVLIDKLSDRHLDAVINQHKIRWDKTKTPSSFHRQEYYYFYKEFLKTMMECNRARVASLELDEKIISIIVCFESFGRVHAYTNTYLEEFARYSPGLILFKFNVDEAIAREFFEYNFGRGDEGYKMRFANKMDETKHITFFKDKKEFMTASMITTVKGIVKKVGGIE